MRRLLWAAACFSGLAWADAAPELAVTLCVACHGEAGNSAVPEFPKIAGQQQKYLEKQLKDFLAGKRKNDAMAPFLANLKPEDIPVLASYYAKAKPTPGVVGDAALAERGRKIYDDGNTDSGVPACAGCHGSAGTGSPRFPGLAGQHTRYVVQQMMDFKGRLRRNGGEFMNTIGERMTAAEILAVAEYVAGMPVEVTQ